MLWVIKKQKKSVNKEWRNLELRERISYSLINGKDEFIEDDVELARLIVERPIMVIEGHLMEWHERSRRFVWRGKNVFTSGCKVS